MKTEELVEYVREVCIDTLVECYAENFTNLELDEFKDSGMRRLAVAWKTSDAATQSSMKQLVRLGAQNSVASLLAIFDDSSSHHRSELSLVAKRADGETFDIGQDLLNEFWSQEERRGQVNAKP